MAELNTPLRFGVDYPRRRRVWLRESVPPFRVAPDATIAVFRW